MKGRNSTRIRSSSQVNMAQAYVDRGCFSAPESEEETTDDNLSRDSDTDSSVDENSNEPEEAMVDHNFEKRVLIGKSGKNKGKRSVKVT